MSKHTYYVLGRVFEERERQVKIYGSNDDLEDRPERPEGWVYPYSAANDSALQREFREDYSEHCEAHGKPTWMHLLREEFAEAMEERDDGKLATELIQLAALCVSWVEKIETRQAWR